MYWKQTEQDSSYGEIEINVIQMLNFPDTGHPLVQLDKVCQSTPLQSGINNKKHKYQF